MIRFDEFVSEVETLARTHVGQARETVLAAFGQPRLDTFTRTWLDKSLQRVHVATGRQRTTARALLAQALAAIEVHAC